MALRPPGSPRGPGRPDPDAVDKLRAALRLLRLRPEGARPCIETMVGWLNRVGSVEELLDEVARHPVPSPASGRRPVLPRPVSAQRIARAILAARDDLGGRFASAEEVAAVDAADVEVLAALVHTGCELAASEGGGGGGPAASPPPTIAVLLPMRLETRFFPPEGAGTDWTLKVRVVPDAASLDRHQPLPSNAELAAIEQLWIDADGDLTTDVGRAQWYRFASKVGSAGRAAWLARTFPGIDDGAGWRIDRPDDVRDELTGGRVAGLPSELQVWLGRGGGAPALAATMSVDADRLTLDPPDADAGEERWWTSFSEAVLAGLGVEIDVGTTPGDIDVLFVVGLGDDEPAALFGAHRDAGTLGVLPLGAATNTIAGEPAADLARDPEAWRELVVTGGAQQEGARQVSYALTGSTTALLPLPGGDPSDVDVGQAMVAALWSALWGHGVNDVWDVDGFGLAEWAIDNLVPEGPFPPIRIGDQPYGVLPVTSVEAWAADGGDPAVEERVRDVVNVLRPGWAVAAEAAGTSVGAGTDRLLDLIAQVPSSRGYAWRWLLPLELVHALWWAFGSGVQWAKLVEWWEDLARPVTDLRGGPPARRYATPGWPGDIAIPLVQPDNLDIPFDEAVHRILSVPPGVLASESRRRELLQPWPNSLFLRLLVHALAVNGAEVARAAQGVAGPLLDPVAVDDKTPTELYTWGTQFHEGQLADNPQTRIHEAARFAAEQLAKEPVEVLERVLRATLDTATHRVDPWITGLASRRLRSLSGAATPPAFRLGVYGWVDAPRPSGAAGPPDEYFHAPSEAQALTTAILRDRARFDAEPGRWAIDVDSDGVRLAAQLAAEVRLGAHLSEALGRAVERVVAADADVKRLRRDFPIRTEHAGRRVCDGLAIVQRLRTNPSSLALDAQQLAGIDELAEAVDTYGDLLTAGAVFDVVSGRAALAARSMEAAAGLAAPPTMDVLATPRSGRSVNTTVVMALPDAAPPSAIDPSTSPGAAAEPAAAALLAGLASAGGPAWTWEVLDGDGAVVNEVTLAGLGLVPVDTLSLSPQDLAAAALELGGGATLRPAGELPAHARCRRLADLLGSRPVVPGDLTPDASTPSDAAVHGELLDRYETVHTLATALQTALVAAGTGNEAEQATQLRNAMRWGITPLTADEPTVPVRVARALAALTDRLGRAPTPTAAAGQSVEALARSLAELVSPEGRLSVLSRMTLDALPVVLAPDGPSRVQLDPGWLEVVATVRPPLARLEAEQLGRAVAGEPALAAWTSRPGDPWQTSLGADPGPLGVQASTHLIAAFGPDGTLDAAGDPDRPVALGLVDTWGEVIPSTEQATQVAFHFDAPGARAPQAILIAVPPVVDEPIDVPRLVAILGETRQSVRARMAPPERLGPWSTGAPTVVLPVHDPGVDLEPTP